MEDTNPQERDALVLVPAPLDFGCEEQVPITEVLPLGTIERASRITRWICENAKTCRAFLKRVGEHSPLLLPIQQQQITPLAREIHKRGDHDGQFDARPFLLSVLQLKVNPPGAREIGLISEAGMPAVLDPGSSVVRAAHMIGLKVEPLVGPCSPLLALAASGLNGQHFACVGYLPIDISSRARRVKELERLARETGQTQVFIEVPYRNQALWQALLSALRPDTLVSVASGLTLSQARVRTAAVAQWRKECAAPGQLPCVICIGRQLA